MKHVLVTGASGFIGRAFCALLKDAGENARYAYRYIPEPSSRGLDYIVIGDIGPNTDWTDALRDIKTVVHLAGRAHVIKDVNADSLAVFRSVNVDGTKHLARAAADNGVKRFIYLSSVKVYGEGSPAPYTEQDLPKPKTPYGISKWEAEQALHEVAVDTGLEVVIIRAPLVYGPKAKANFLHLIRLVESGVPLPFAGIYNRRSMIYIGNLLSAIFKCMTHPKAASETFSVSDGQDISTPDLVRMISFEMGKSPALFPLPVIFLKTLGSLMGRKEDIDKLITSSFVDISKIQIKINWHPTFTVEEGIKETIKNYKLI